MRSNAEHFFETDLDQQRRQRRSAKAANKAGHPVVLRAKILAVLADPASPDHVFVGESGGGIRRVNVGAEASTAATGDVFRGPTAPVTSLALSPDGHTLFAGCWDKTVWSFDVASRQPGRRYAGGHSDFVKALAVGRLGGGQQGSTSTSTSTTVLISGGADRKIVVWDVASGRRLHTLQDAASSHPMLAVQSLAIEGDGGQGEDEDEGPERDTAAPGEIFLASASSDPHIRRWRIRTDGWTQEADADANGSAGTDAPRRTILAHETTVYGLVFDGHALWTASADGTAQRLAGFRRTTTLAHGDHVRAVAVTETWVVTAGRDENIKFWDNDGDSGSSSSAAQTKPYATVRGHFDEVTGLAVLAGGRRLCSVSLDGTVRSWPLAKAALDALVQEQAQEEEDGDGADDGEQTKNAKDGGGSGLTAEEEAELAALMED